MVDMKTDSMASSRHLRELRRSRGLTLRDAAEAGGGLSHNTVRRVETTPTPWEFLTLGTMQGLALAYGVSLEHIVRLAIGDAVLPTLESSKWVRIPTKSGGDMVHVPSSFFTPPQVSPDNVRGAQIAGDWAATREILYRPETRPGTWILTSDVVRASPRDVVVADAYLTDGTLWCTVMFQASEGGRFSQCRTLDPVEDISHEALQLPSANQGQSTSEIDNGDGGLELRWITRGPIVYFTR
jgi:transcriptional regulator with XRE-family HTH domain